VRVCRAQTTQTGPGTCLFRHRAAEAEAEAGAGAEKVSTHSPGQAEGNYLHLIVF